MSDSEAFRFRQVVRTIEDLVTEFAYRVDFQGGRSVAELFCVDGVYEADGRRSVGRSAIEAAYERRAALGPRTARHLFTNVRVRPALDGCYDASCLMLLFADNGFPPLPAYPLLVADVLDRYCTCQGELLLASRRLASVFVRPDASPVLPLEEEGEAIIRGTSDA